VDKHSTGGVGDKISLVLAPLVAACGVASPMLAGRGLGHTGGTIDKLESIAGWRGELPPAALVRLLERVGFFIAAQSPRIAPADRVLYALRDATATVESIPLIAASIVSKKVAGGADALVMDVKVGRGAFLHERGQAPALARAIVGLCAHLGLPATALLTDMDQPLGHEVGNASEVAEALAVLRGEGPRDVRELTLRLGVEMLLAGRAAPNSAAARVRLERALDSGAALERFLYGMRLQGGAPRLLEQPGRLPRARRQLLVRAPRAGYVIDLHPRLVGQAAMALGAGRRRKEDRIDPGVGVTVHARRGDRVAAGEPLATLWYNDATRLASARPAVLVAYRLGAAPPPSRSLVVRRIPAAPFRAP
jgi:pyrimidine-nucleoside phosphorylase